MKKLLLKYGIVGLLGTLIHFISLYVLVEAFGIQPVTSSTLGFLLVLFISYVLNKWWTFQDTPSGWKPFVKYTVVSLTGLLLNSGIMYAVVEWMHWNYLLGQCLVVVAVPASNFLFNYYWTFRT
ncbi:Putative flippase GtrA (transmembrane translocase of bactoprenol-linked glucose) [Paenibacillus sp. 1_12]|uniref:GtrA family protein n=1 Tax=Paenibacillus sp. 1_12 TaxID=1566278 RepID=UPI0008E3F658|nr:GtrA family protein [Paenibacillus sp. 1_12]SFL64359.1 Putative flippase GtrA (transmembrane translocase of bactoprenol-linked glucose) [Paenibacillus sp. 1_12]